MKSYKLSINILPSSDDQAINKYIPYVGSKLSTYDNIMFNINKSGYSINYTTDIFENIDPSILADNLVKIIKANFNNIAIVIGINYYHGSMEFSKIAGMNMIYLDECLEDYQEIPVVYEESDTIDLLLRAWDDDENEFDFDSLSEDNDDDDDDDEDFQSISDYLTNLGLIDDDDDEDEQDFAFKPKHSKPKKKKVKKSHKFKKLKYESIVFRKSKNAKKNTKRHGVLTYSKKKYLDKDRKAIKEMIKAFIPGNSKWIKNFRDELTDRWVDAFCISKKRLNKKIKKFNKDQKKNRYRELSRYGLGASEIIRNILAPPQRINKWSDPSR